MLTAQRLGDAELSSSLHNAKNAAEESILAASAAIRKLAPGETLYIEGELAISCFQVVSGVVKEYNTLIDGRRQITDFYSLGNIFGISEADEYLHTAEAVTNCVVRIFPRDTYLQYALASREQSQKIVTDLMTRLHRAEERAIMLGRMNARQRVATFLQRLSEDQGHPQKIRISMSRQDIADHLGLTIETVCRVLTELKKTGYIDMDGARILSIKEPERMENIACVGSTML